MPFNPLIMPCSETEVPIKSGLIFVIKSKIIIYKPYDYSEPNIALFN